MSYCTDYRVGTESNSVLSHIGKLAGMCEYMRGDMRRSMCMHTHSHVSTHTHTRPQRSVGLHTLSFTHVIADIFTNTHNTHTKHHAHTYTQKQRLSTYAPLSSTASQGTTAGRGSLSSLSSSRLRPM